ncbi:primase-helicase family protein [Cupriavidus sp. M-11]|uniref:primase-helicase family protein n=1 Tax=Cupriavidus sp. M-11 TaxID=3233038 RepID=UPI003F8F7B88
MTDQDRKHVTQVMADIVQNPCRRPQHGLIVTGEQGTGKSTLFRIVRAALGGRHVYDGTYGSALSSFSEVFVKNLLVVVDDDVGRKDTYERLKSNITKTETSVEIKGVQEAAERNKCQCNKIRFN